MIMVVTGNNYSIQPGVVIGADGFSYELNEQSFELEIERFPHIGRIKIGPNVEVSSIPVIAGGK